MNDRGYKMNTGGLGGMPPVIFLTSKLAAANRRWVASKSLTEGCLICHSMACAGIREANLRESEWIEFQI